MYEQKQINKQTNKQTNKRYTVQCESQYYKGILFIHDSPSGVQRTPA